MDSEVGGDSQVEQMDTTSDEVRHTGEDGLNGDESINKRNYEDGRAEEASEKDTEGGKVIDDTTKTDDKSKVGGDPSKTEEEKIEGGEMKEEEDKQEGDAVKKSTNKEREGKRAEKVEQDLEKVTEDARLKKHLDDSGATGSEGDTEEGRKGELDKSVIVEGKRKRHAVERMVISPDTGTRKPKPTVPGQGIALGDIPYVREAFEKFRGPMLQGLFRLCFGRQGTRQALKKELRKFNGFPFDENDVQFRRRKALAQKFSVDDLKKMSSILGIERAAIKSDMITNILSFLLKPKDLGKSPTLLVKRKKGSKKRNRETKKNEKKGEKKEPKAKKPKKSKEVASSEESEGDSSEGDDNDEEEEQEQQESVHHEKASATKKTTHKDGNIATKKSSSKGGDQCTKEDKKESQWGVGGPTDVELNEEIDMLLHTMDLSQATMKEMCVEIAGKFPNLNMDKYKGALKQRIKSALDKLDA